jgi:hypothetical protein
LIQGSNPFILASNHKGIVGFVMKGIMVGCMMLALIAAVFYLLVGAGIITLPPLGIKLPSMIIKSGPQTIAYGAGGCYILGGLLILAEKRWLWIVGLVINTLVIAIHFMIYRNNLTVMLSLPSLATKVPQIILDIGLVYLIATYQKSKLS